MLRTTRCLIKLLNKSDINEVKELYTNEKVRRYLGGTYGEEQIKTAIGDMVIKESESLYWVAREIRTNTFIGLVSLSPHHDGHDVELSYQVLPTWWGKGYGLEITQVILHYAFDELSLKRVIAETQLSNIKSCNLLKRLGMKLEKEIERFGAQQCIYSISSSSRK